MKLKKYNELFEAMTSELAQVEIEYCIEDFLAILNRTFPKVVADPEFKEEITQFLVNSITKYVGKDYHPKVNTLKNL